MASSGASRMAAARLERAQARDAVRKTPSSTSAASYGAFWDGSRSGAPAPAGAEDAAAGSPAPSRSISPSMYRKKSIDTEGLEASGLHPSDSVPSAAPNSEQAHGQEVEIGVPMVPLSTSDAFAVATLEGALHENHDRAAAALLPDGTALFVCLDGHGSDGASVSSYAARNLMGGVAAALQAGKSPAEALMVAFQRTSATMPHNVKDCRFSGSTAIFTILHREPQGRVLTTAWVGDSRAVLARNRQAAPAATGVMNTQLQPIPLTKDHKPTDPKERQRLLEARAIVRPSRIINPHTGQWIEVGAVRVWDASQIYGVAMSRALGDMQVHPYLIPTPDVSKRLLDENDRILVLATDGIWDVMENDEAVRKAMVASPLDACQELVDTCARRWDVQMPGRRDDITTLVVDLSHPDLAL